MPDFDAQHLDVTLTIPKSARQTVHQLWKTCPGIVPSNQYQWSPCFQAISGLQAKSNLQSLGKGHELLISIDMEACLLKLIEHPPSILQVVDHDLEGCHYTRRLLIVVEEVLSHSNARDMLSTPSIK